MLVEEATGVLYSVQCTVCRKQESRQREYCTDSRSIEATGVVLVQTADVEATEVHSAGVEVI